MRPKYYHRINPETGTYETRAFTSRSKARAWGGYTDRATALRFSLVRPGSQKPTNAVPSREQWIRERATNLETAYTRDGLRNRAGEYGISGRGAMNKQQLAIAVATRHYAIANE